jgi:hypothetical protein
MALTKTLARRRQIAAPRVSRALNANRILSQAIKPKFIALPKHRAGVHNIVGIKRQFYGLKRALLYRSDISFKVLRFQAANPMLSANRATKLHRGIIYHHANALSRVWFCL